MEKYSTWLPFLQKALPVSEEYRKEEPAKNTDIIVYDALFVAGSARAGGATIAMNLPLNYVNQTVVGKRNVQLKNIIEAKFDAILLPISKIIFDKDVKTNISSETFFTNVILIEVAKNLGINYTINNKTTVRDALKDLYTVTDILKSSVLSLFLVEKLKEVDEISNEVNDNYLTMISNMVRVVRLGESSDYAKANLIFFNYLIANQAIEITTDDKINVNYDKLKASIEKLSSEVIVMQGNGIYADVKTFIDKYCTMSEGLKKILNNINAKQIPKDIVFEQGLQYLNL